MSKKWLMIFSGAYFLFSPSHFPFFCEVRVIMKSLTFFSMVSTLLLKNGMGMDVNDGRFSDVLVVDGKIAQVGKISETDVGNKDAGKVEVLDCTGKSIFPGFIDVHAHLRDPGMTHKEDFERGTLAAAAGGITTVCEMPNTIPAVTSREILAQKKALYEKKKAQGKIHANIAFYMGAAFDAKTGLTNVDEFLASDAVAFKIYMADSTGNLGVSNKNALEEIFKKVAEAPPGPNGLDRLVCVHAEDQALIEKHKAAYGESDDPTIHGLIRSEAAAYRAVKEALQLAKKYGTRLHICHVTTKREVDEIRKFKNERISCEVTPHHLAFNEFSVQDRVAKGEGNLLKVNPPIRSDRDRLALWAALKEGVIDMVASDHAPHTVEEKSRPYREAPAGVPGLETLFAVVHSGPGVGAGTLSLVSRDIVRVTNDAPARIFGFESKRGIAVGKDADLVIVDECLAQKVERGGAGARYTKCGWSPFEGITLYGWPEKTIVGGRIVYKVP